MDLFEPPSSVHPLGALLDSVEAAVGAAAAGPLFTLDAQTTATALKRLAALTSQLTAVSLAVLAHGESVDVAGPSGASSTATWLAHAVKVTRSEAFQQTRLAKALDSDRHRVLRDALSQGRVREEQARVIVSAVDQLPTRGEDAVPAEVVAEAEAFLVAKAVDHDAKALRVLGWRLLEVVAPGVADAYGAKRLAAQEKRADEQTRLTMSDDGHGSVFVKAKLPALHAAMLKKLLMAYAAPKHQAAAASAAGVPTPGRRPSPGRMGKAFCDLLETLTDTHAPTAGGTGATVVVTMDWAALTGGIPAAHVDTGETISAGQARRLACQAGIIPAVLGSGSVPLDLGRRTRFHTRAQRIAIALRDGGCTADGCDWPPGMCHVHHDPPWSHGGVTDIDHARMLCPHHHTRAHDPAYEMESQPKGKITFHRRT